MNQLNSRVLGPRVKDMTGMRFERLVALTPAGADGHGNQKWTCKCDCGAIVVCSGTHLRSGNTRSCGCRQKEAARDARIRTGTTHGMHRTRTHGIWNGMMTRCHNANSKDYYRYGGRGVAVCKRWHSFANFLADMGVRPDGMSIDRIDNDKGYEPGNCRWASLIEQARNRRSNRLLRLGDDVKTISAWSEALQIGYSTLTARLRRGWSEERTLTTPMDERFSRA